jgi:hypothetical protein
LLKWTLWAFAALVVVIGGFIGVLYVEIHHTNGEVLSGSAVTAACKAEPIRSDFCRAAQVCTMPGGSGRLPSSFPP